MSQDNLVGTNGTPTQRQQSQPMTAAGSTGTKIHRLGMYKVMLQRGTARKKEATGGGKKSKEVGDENESWPP